MQVEIPSLIDITRSAKRSIIRTEVQVKSLIDQKPLTQRTQRKDFTGKSQLLFDFPSVETSIIPVIQNNSGLGFTKRSISVENPQKKQRVQLKCIKPFEPEARAPNRPRQRFELEPLVLTSLRAQSKVNYSSVVHNTPDRHRLLDEEYNFESAREKSETYRSVPKANTSRIVSVQKDESDRSGKITFRDLKELKEIKEIKDRDKKTPINAVVLPTIKKELTPQDLVFGPHVRPFVLKQHALSVAQGINYACKQVKPLPITQLKSKMIMLKPSSEPFKKTLLLDLDETLINARLPNISGDDYSIVEVNEVSVRVKIRPYAIEFLEKMSKEFEVVIFTAAEKNYAESMIKLLDPGQRYITHVLYRDNCLKTIKGLYIKDLRIIKNRELKDMVLVDNFTPSFCFQVDNGIPIITWDGDVKDQELKYLMNYLMEAKKHDDLRVFNREKLRLRELADVLPHKFAGLQN